MVIPIRDDNPTRRRAYVTIFIIALTVGAYVVWQPHDGGINEVEFTYERAAIPCEIVEQEPLDRAEYAAGTCDSEDSGSEFFPDKSVWLSILYSIFLHGSILHLAGNMLFLWIFGNNVEDYLGKVGFVIFYVAAGFVATVAHVLYEPSSIVPVVGASGAIAGVMGAYLVLWPHARVTALVPFFFFIPMRIPAGLMLLVWFALQFATGDDSGVAWVAHVGGFAFGVVVAWLLSRLKPPEPRLEFQQLS